MLMLCVFILPPAGCCHLQWASQVQTMVWGLHQQWQLFAASRCSDTEKKCTPSSWLHIFGWNNSLKLVLLGKPWESEGIFYSWGKIKGVHWKLKANTDKTQHWKSFQTKEKECVSEKCIEHKNTSCVLNIAVRISPWISISVFASALLFCQNVLVFFLSHSSFGRLQNHVSPNSEAASQSPGSFFVSSSFFSSANRRRRRTPVPHCHLLQSVYVPVLQPFITQRWKQIYQAHMSWHTHICL